MVPPNLTPFHVQSKEDSSPGSSQKITRESSFWERIPKAVKSLLIENFWNVMFFV